MKPIKKAKGKKAPFALLLNDIHVSKDNIPEFIENWNEALRICADRAINEIFVGGDLWQSRSGQNLSVLMAVRQAIIKATENDIDVTLAEGNHDKVDQESVLGYSHLFSEYPGVWAIDNYAAIDFGENNSCTIFIMSYFPENGSFIKRLQDLIKKDFDPEQYNILYIHEGIRGGLATSSDDELPADIFKDFDKVLVGHYHDRKHIPNTNIEYIGSSRQHNFGEDNMKGYTILYDDGSYEFVQNQANVRYEVVDVNADEINSEFIEGLNDKLNDYFYKVKVRVNCKANEAVNVNKAALLDAGVTRVEIVAEDTPTATISSQSLESKFDKTGIKSEYNDFCSEKEIDEVELGLNYLDKIDDYVEA